MLDLDSQLLVKYKSVMYVQLFFVTVKKYSEIVLTLLYGCGIIFNVANTSN